MQGFSLEQLRPLLEPITTCPRIYVGYSGGLDSQVLLHSLHALQFPITAIHIHHQLSPHADAWQRHCQAICHALPVPLIARRVDAKATIGESPEACARNARYAAFKEIVQPGEALVLAHHQDDQAETLLLQLLRGAGPKGLAAMPHLSSVDGHFVLRPLLDFTREELLAFARAQGLQWIDDESNADLRFDRNYLRHAVLPHLKTRWSRYSKTLARSSEHCAEAVTILDEVAATDMAQNKGRVDATLSVKKLLQLSTARRRNVLRYWILQQHLPLPSQLQLQQLEHDILAAGQNAQPLLCWPDAQVRRYQDDLYVMAPLAAFDAHQVIAWDLKAELQLHDCVITAQQLPEQIINTSTSEPYTLRFRHEGEGTPSLKKRFQSWQIPPWLRSRVPLLYRGETLVAIYNLNTKKFCITGRI